MFSVDESANSISFKFSSEMKLVDRAVKETREFLCGAGLEQGFSSLKLVLRELLINAVEHGNRKMPTLAVKCSIEKIGESICKIAVEDEGEGFAWKDLSLKIPDDPNKMRNRGYPLVNALSDRIEFNEKGNRVEAFVPFLKETGYEVEESGAWRIVTPSGDITAASSKPLRELLERLVSSGMEACRFDFANVADIDSVGLSTMIVLSRAMNERGVKEPKLEVVNAPTDIKRLFEMTMLDTIYKLVPSDGGAGSAREGRQ